MSIRVAYSVNLGVTIVQDGNSKKRIRVSFKLPQDILAGSDTTVYVYGAKSGWREDIPISSGNKGDVITKTIDVPCFGEYGIHVSCNRGYTYHLVEGAMVGIQTPIYSEKYTFTQTDIFNAAMGDVVFNLMLLAIPGLVGYKMFQAAGAVGGLVISAVSNVGVIAPLSNGYDTNAFEDYINVGWSIQTKLEQVGNEIITTTYVTDASGNSGNFNVSQNLMTF